LGHGEPLGGAQVLTDGAKDGGNGVESHAHDAVSEWGSGLHKEEYGAG
jgi:hypothetical protein